MQRERVVHLPEHVELELKDLERALLRGPGREMLERELQAVLDVALREPDAALEILEPAPVDPRIVLGPVRKTLLVDLGREKLGQRRARRFLPRRTPRSTSTRLATRSRRRPASSASRSHDSIPPGLSP